MWLVPGKDVWVVVEQEDMNEFVEEQEHGKELAKEFVEK